jgi:hypothetical protein
LSVVEALVSRACQRQAVGTTASTRLDYRRPSPLAEGFLIFFQTNFASHEDNVTPFTDRAASNCSADGRLNAFSVLIVRSELATVRDGEFSSIASFSNN